MKTIALMLISCALALAGCASVSPPGSSPIAEVKADLGHLKTFTAEDFDNASLLGIAARNAGKLPAADRWPECFAQVAAKIRGAQVGLGAKPGVATVAMVAHIMASGQGGGVTAECAQVYLELEAKGIKLAATFFPGAAPIADIVGKLGPLKP